MHHDRENTHKLTVFATTTSTATATTATAAAAATCVQAFFQPDMKECKTVREVSGTLNGECYKELMYVGYHVPVISNRDCFLYSHQYHGSDTNRADKSKRMITAMSVVDNAVPKVKGYTRGDLRTSRTCFSSVEGGKSTEICTMMLMDPKGMLPAGLVNTAVATAVDAIVTMRKYMEDKARVFHASGKI
jgi:hypothetical protein